MTLPDRRDPAPDYDELLRLAEEATPGPWWADAGSGGFGTIFVGTSFETRSTWLFDRREASVADAAFIAAANPQVVTDLIHRLQAAHEALRHIRQQIVGRHPGYAGDHYVWTVQFNRASIDRIDRALGEARHADH